MFGDAKRVPRAVERGRSNAATPCGKMTCASVSAAARHAVAEGTLPPCNAVLRSGNMPPTPGAGAVCSAGPKTICLSRRVTKSCRRSSAVEAADASAPTERRYSTSLVHRRPSCVSFASPTSDELAPYADDWERLAGGVPFRSWTWLGHWWRHYGPQNEADALRTRLAVLGVFDDAKSLMGVAPWYLECSAMHGRVLRPLGSGEVCSDYLSLLCHPATEEAVVEALADYLVENALRDDPDAFRWDLLELDGVDAEDRTVADLVNSLAVSGCTVHRRPGVNCWRLELPTDWDSYVASLGRNLRRDLRRLERELLEHRPRGAPLGHAARRAAPGHGHSRRPAPAAAGHAGRRRLFRLGPVPRLLSRRRARTAPPRPGPVLLAGTRRPAGGRGIPTGGQTARCMPIRRAWIPSRWSISRAS